ncbi:uncharacterized protein LOC143268442 [Peromyscus maniculatus bairdii]|uniref:uncharacterized protein LOC143268442 n=1 Tax=Peromyscus maniculatus bairdii TaxID=230844 RepID=UPI003FD39B24
MALSSHLNRESLTFTQARVNGPTRRGARWEFAQPHVTRPRRSGPGGPRSSARAAWRRRRPRSTGEPRPVRLTGRRSPRARTSHAARSAPGPAEVTLTRPRFLSIAKSLSMLSLPLSPPATAGGLYSEQGS